MSSVIKRNRYLTDIHKRQIFHRELYRQDPEGLTGSLSFRAVFQLLNFILLTPKSGRLKKRFSMTDFATC